MQGAGRWGRRGLLVASLVATPRGGHAQQAPADSARRPASADSTRRPAAQALAAVRITAVQGAGMRLARPASVLEGRTLDQRRAPSIAATIAGEPGVTSRSNGPMATQPVIRGLTGDRVLVLEDGQRTGDIATTAPDHAVTIDPLAATRIEVVRGPAGLLFGSNTLGGVVNVVREDVPRRRPDRRLSGQLSGHGESVNAGGAASAQLSGAVGPLAWKAAGTWRTAGDTRTPADVLPFTDIRGHDVGVGGALVEQSARGGRWRVGVAGRDVSSAYGVPSSFGGITLPGAHAGGVYVDLSRRSGRVEAEWQREASDATPNDASPDASAFAPRVQQISIAGQGVRFAQSELERGGFVGTRFGQLMASGDAVVRYTRGSRIPVTGVVGGWWQWRDFRAEGSFTGTRPAVQRGQAAFVMEEWQLAPLLGTARAVALQLGVRHDVSRIVPLDSTETALVQNVRTRAFRGTTGSVALEIAVASGLTVGASAARAFRPPAIEELFSNGPHLATYAYEVGNPALRAERGRGLDVFARLARRTVQADVAVFSMRLDDYIYQQPLLDVRTGEPVRDARLRRYNVYRAAQSDARMHGAEGRVTWTVPRWPGTSLDGVLSWVEGTQRLPSASGAVVATPLPAMPPLRTRLALRHDRARWGGAVTIEQASRQTRVPPSAGVASAGTCAVTASSLAATATATATATAPGTTTGSSAAPPLLPAEFCPTAGWTQLHLSASRRWMLGRTLHEVTGTVTNLFDVAWRDHLWRAKQVAPQPGRNLQVLYRVAW